MTTASRVSSVVASRYANAFLDLVEKDKATASIEKDVQDLQATIVGSDDLLKFIENPLMSRSAQETVMAEIVKKGKFAPLTHNFLKTLIENKRFFALPQILSAVEQSLSKRRGEKAATVTVAQDLTAAQLKDLKSSLEKASGSTVLLNVQVDPSILGGMIVTMDSKMVDDSVARKLEKLEAVMSRGANENTNQNLSEVV